MEYSGANIPLFEEDNTGLIPYALFVRTGPALEVGEWEFATFQICGADQTLGVYGGRPTWDSDMDTASKS